MIHTNNYSLIYLKGDKEKVSEEWVQIGKALYNKYEELYGGDAIDIMAELFGKVISGEKKVENVYWG
jgi:hypothetical protein